MLRQRFGGVAAAALITGVALALGAPGTVGASGGQASVAAGNVGQRAVITRAPRKTTHSTRAAFRFRGADVFKCSLDFDRYRSCKSPQRYGGLSRRSHRFRVRAVISVNGNLGPVATYHWRIRRFH